MAKILVVDNNTQIVSLLEELLYSDGHNVDSAFDGEAALKLISENSYEVGFIDLGLPDIDGMEVLKQFRNRLPQAIPIVVSGHNDSDHIVSALNEGVYEYICKPFDIDDLLNTVKRAVDENSRMRNTGYAYKRNMLLEKSDQTNRWWSIVGSFFTVVLAIMAGFLTQQLLLEQLNIPSLWRVEEIAYLILSFACGYGFVCLLGHNVKWLRDTISYNYRDYFNLYASSILFILILFFAAGFKDARIAISFGIIYGTAGLVLLRFIASRTRRNISSEPLEGHRKLQIKTGKKTEYKTAGAHVNSNRTVPGNEPVSGKFKSLDELTEGLEAGLNAGFGKRLDSEPDRADWSAKPVGK